MWCDHKILAVVWLGIFFSEWITYTSKIFIDPENLMVRLLYNKIRNKYLSLLYRYTTRSYNDSRFFPVTKCLYYSFCRQNISKIIANMGLLWKFSRPTDVVYILFEKWEGILIYTKVFTRYKLLPSCNRYGYHCAYMYICIVHFVLLLLSSFCES